MKNLVTAIFVLHLISCKSQKELPTVAEVDLNKYAGTWYEIARLPNRFEKGLECVTANYTLLENGKIDVLNDGHQAEDRGKIDQAKGKAWVPDPKEPGRLKVSFFWPFAGDYYIIKLDKDYKYVLVGDPSRKYLWILCRARTLDEKVYNELLETAQVSGFDTKSLIKIKQDCQRC